MWIISPPVIFQQRFLVNDTFYSNGSSPIFFYAGNENDIEYFFWQNSGFITDVLAQEFIAMVIFAEHRYYGQSLPFGQASFATKNLAFLSSQQALADYAVIISTIKAQLNSDPPVIAFGGSYGGLLAAFLRMKYPWIIDGALASSAALQWYFGTPLGYDRYPAWACNEYDQAGCGNWLREAISLVNEMGTSNASNGELQELSQRFKLCAEMRTIDDFNTFFAGWLQGTFLILNGNYAVKR